MSPMKPKVKLDYLEGAGGKWYWGFTIYYRGLEFVFYATEHGDVTRWIMCDVPPELENFARDSALSIMDNTAAVDRNTAAVDRKLPPMTTITAIAAWVLLLAAKRAHAYVLFIIVWLYGAY